VADGSCRQRFIKGCERSGVRYLIGLPRNPRLRAQVEFAQLALKDDYERTRLATILVT
jgi:hypothetical protein